MKTELTFEQLPNAIACLMQKMESIEILLTTKKDDSQVIAKLSELAELHPTRGFDEYFGRIRNEGLKWNRKRVLRVYRSMNLKMRRKRKRRLPKRIQTPLTVPVHPNVCWSMDFMSDALTSGRKLRVFNVIDDYNREALAVEVDFSFPAQGVIRVLDEISLHRKLPQQIRVDNGPEFISKTLVKWCNSKGVALSYIQPGKPAQNAFIERFNRLFREDVLDAYLFDTIQQTRIISTKWKDDYNYNHPHGSLKGMSPKQYLAVNCGKLSEFTTINSHDNNDENSKLVLS